jgi:hypothetical protein
LRFLIEQRQVPVVHADDRTHPAGGSARTGQPAHRLIEERRIALQTTPLLRLQQREEPDLVERFDRFLGQPPQILGRLGALP